MMGPRALICSVVVLAVLHTVQSQKKPPKITAPDKKLTRDILPSSSVVQDCTAEGNPTPQYRWTLNGEEITSSNIEVDETTGQLRVISFSDAEVGRYQCIAENTISPGVVAAAMSSLVTMRKIQIGTNWTSTLKQITKQEGDYLKLTCDNAPRSVPDGQLKWYRVEGNSNEGVTTDNRVYIDEEGSLHFAYLSPSDEEVNKIFKCGLYNSELDIIKLGSDTDLTVNAVSGSTPQSESVIQFFTDPAKFLTTRDATLECVFGGNPVPMITWYDSQDNLITNSVKFTIKDHNRKLVIHNLVEDDEGMYKCKGDNTGGTAEQSLFLDVTSGPIWQKSLSSQTVPEDEDAVFTCKARAARGENELDPPLWFKNGVTMNVDSISSKYEFTENYKVLTVKNLNKTTDIMCFQCNVSNDIGYEFGDGCLTVIEPIVITVKPSLEQEITKGDMVNLTVNGTTDPAYTLKFRWYFNNVSYDDPSHPPHVTFNATTMQAYINTSDLTDEQYNTINGTYIRELYHEDDRRNLSIVVILSDVAVVGTVAAAAVDLWWIALIVALIILIIVIILIVIICNRKRQEGAYPLDKKERANDIDPERDLADSGFQDLSRAQGDDDYPTKKSQGINPNFDYDDVDNDDDDESLMEYGGADFDTTKFNEDGSFIGQYTSKNKTPEVKHSPVPLNHHATESQI